MRTRVRFCVLPWPSRNGTAKRQPNRSGATARDVLHERCAGIDISKRDAKVCVRIPSARRKGMDGVPRRGVRGQLAVVLVVLGSAGALSGSSRQSSSMLPSGR